MSAIKLNNLFRLRLDEYSSLGTKSYEDDEISDILTQAQLRLVKRYAKVYEKDEYARKVLSKLVSGPYAQEYINSDSKNEGYPTNLNNETFVDNSSYKVDDNSIIFKLPANVLRVVYEEIIVDNLSLDVYPTTHDEYRKVRRNKYRKPNDRKAIRLDVQAYDIQSNDNISNPAKSVSTSHLGHEIISDKFKDAQSITYNIRYIQAPQDIVYSQIETDCKDSYLPEFMYDEIADEAVLIALEISQEQRLQTFAQIKQGNN